MHPDLLSALERLKELRLTEKWSKEDAQELQSSVLPMLLEDDPNDEGVFVEAFGNKYVAHYQQNRTPEDWDLEKLVPWLIAQGHWQRVCTEILDQAKLESEIKAGRIPRRQIAKFIVKGNPPNPFVRFAEKKSRRVRVKRKK